MPNDKHEHFYEQFMDEVHYEYNSNILAHIVDVQRVENNRGHIVLVLGDYLMKKSMAK